MTDVEQLAAQKVSTHESMCPEHRRYLALGIDVAGLECLVVGGGRVGAHKAMTLAEGGAVVTVLAPDLCERLREPVRQGTLLWVNSRYADSHLEGFTFVVAATSDPALNIQIGRDAEARKMLACVVSPGRFSRLIFPATHSVDGLTVAVHSNGLDCSRSREVRDEIAKMLSQRPAPQAQLAVFGLKREDVPSDVFGALKEDLLEPAPGQLGIDVVVLATCQRWECYFLSPSPGAAVRHILRVVQQRCGVLLEAHRSALYRKHEAGAFHHLLRVTAGLDSPLRGETDIVGQVRAAAERCLGDRASTLGRVFESCLVAQKSIRKKSGLTAEGKNWATATLSLLKRQIAPLESRRIVLFGWGELSKAIAFRLRGSGARVVPFSRRANRSDVSLGSNVDLKVRPLEAVSEHLAAADALVLSSHLSPDLVEAVRARISGRDLAVIDLRGSHHQQLKDNPGYFGLSEVADIPLSRDEAVKGAEAEKLAFEQALRWHAQESPFEGPLRGTLRIGARPSELSRAQVSEVLELLGLVVPDVRFDLVSVDVPCDRDKTTPLPEVDADDFFTRELDAALWRGEIDLAIHSAKDLPARIPDGLHVAAVTPAFAPWECLVGRGSESLAELPAGARVGTSSVRRRQRLTELRPDVRPCDVRGNVPERLAQLDEGAYDALVLAAAGLIRLGLQHRVSQVFTLDEFPPAPGQGSLALVVRDGDIELRRLLEPLDLGDRKGLPWA